MDIHDELIDPRRSHTDCPVTAKLKISSFSGNDIQLISHYLFEIVSASLSSVRSQAGRSSEFSLFMVISSGPQQLAFAGLFVSPS